MAFRVWHAAGGFCKVLLMHPAHINIRLCRHTTLYTFLIRSYRKHLVHKLITRRARLHISFFLCFHSLTLYVTPVASRANIRLCYHVTPYAFPLSSCIVHKFAALQPAREGPLVLTAKCFWNSKNIWVVQFDRKTNFGPRITAMWTKQFVLYTWNKSVCFSFSLASNPEVLLTLRFSCTKRSVL